jgi:hypothetical protein
VFSKLLAAGWLLASLAPACADAPAPPAASSTNPFAAHALAPEQRTWLDGSVEETLNAGSYVYVRVRSGGADIWVATLAATLPPRPLGRVRVLVVGRAEGFHSRRLGRDFQSLAFGVIRRDAGAEENPITRGIEP